MSQMSFFDDETPKRDPDDLAEAEPEEQKEVMKAWFLAHYDDPVNVCPYESREGGFQYIWSGPYDAQEELSGEFGGVVDNDVIAECAQELVDEHSCYEWSGPPDYEQSDDYLAEAIETSRFCETFGHSLDTIRQLLEIDPPLASKGYFIRLLYASAITALEAYLSDAFIVTVFADRNLLCRLVATDPTLKARKVELTGLVRGDNTPEKIVREHLLQISWHNLARVRKLYKTVLGVDWPDRLGVLYNAVMIRHDIVHRNGRTTDGEERVLSREDVEGVIGAAKDLVNAIDEKVRQLQSDHDGSSEEPF